MNGVEKLILAIVGLVIVLLVAGWAIKTTRNTQDQANGVNTQLSDKVNTALEMQYTQYDGKVVSGSEVVNMIKDTYAASDYIQVGVKTSAGSTVAFVTDRTIGATTAGPGNKSSATYTAAIANAENITNANYISPTGSFKGVLTRDANGTIVEILFTQQ